MSLFLGSSLPSGLVGLPISGSRVNKPVSNPSGSIADASMSVGNPAGDLSNPTWDSSNPDGVTNPPNGERNRPSNTLAGPSELTSLASITTTLNFLPLSNTQRGNAVEGIYVRDGQPWSPAKLSQKIQHWEIRELFPKFSQYNDEAAGKKAVNSWKPWQVTDIFLWMQCFTTYVWN